MWRARSSHRGISLRADDSRNTNRKRFRWLSPSNQPRKSRDAALFQQQASHKPVETVSGMANSRDGCEQRRRNIRIGPNIGVRTSGQFEQIVALGARQGQRPRQPIQRFRRRLYRTSLFDPRAPGRADAGFRGQFFTPQPRGAPPAARFHRPRALAVSTDEFAQKPSLICSEHRTIYNRITFAL